MLSELLSIEMPAKDVCVFWFDGPAPYVTSVAAICRDGVCLVIDSYCGSYYMDAVRQELERRFAPREFRLLNTHHHWDHIWGNVSFSDSPIYSSPLCRQNMEALWQEQLEENQMFFRGRQESLLPTVMIEHPTEILPQLFAFPSPGHTDDSLSLWDSKNKILFAGDLLELPVVQLCHRNLPEYQQTLRCLRKLMPKTVISGHCRNSSPDIIEMVSAYLDALAEGKNLHFSDKIAEETHLSNLRLLS